jgi:hypothetical protein
MAKYVRTWVAFLSLLLPLVSAVGCAAVEAEPQAKLLEDLQPPTQARDESLRQAREPVPMPTETSNLRADPDDPRLAASLEDLEVRKPGRPQAGEPRPLPEEEPPPRR